MGDEQPRPNPGLLPSLGRLVRGLSTLFWGIPVALVICVDTAKTDWLRFGAMGPLAATALLLLGLLFLAGFQPQERVWRRALDHAIALAVINAGLAPFLFWWNRLPWHPFFTGVAHLMLITGLLFLFALNPMLVRLTAMLPDETLRAETRLFTGVNRIVLAACITLQLCYMGLGRMKRLPQVAIEFLVLWEGVGEFILLFLVLLAVAVTMGLIWKTKEVILASVFGEEP